MLYKIWIESTEFCEFLEKRLSQRCSEGTKTGLPYVAFSLAIAILAKADGEVWRQILGTLRTFRWATLKEQLALIKT